jgi:hypothetical protein
MNYEYIYEAIKYKISDLNHFHLYLAWNLIPYSIITIPRAFASRAFNSILKVIPTKQFAALFTHVDDLTLQAQGGQELCSFIS